MANSTPLDGVKILLGVSSSIAAHRALDLASMIRKAGGEVRVVLSEHVSKLIAPAAFDAITHQRTVSSLWDSDHSGDMDHLSATKWADQFVIAPATANALFMIAHGAAEDALSTFAVAWSKAPLIIAPAMNPQMWRNAAVRDNVKMLRARGHEFVGPVMGVTACDDEGIGRLAPVEEIFAAIVKHAPKVAGDRDDAQQETLGGGAAMLSQKRLSGKHVLITAGPTREFADDVRCITNPSTGRQGIALAEAASAEGANVTLILGPTTLIPPVGTRTIRVITADEMLKAVLDELPRANYAIFAAAVSDWKPAERFQGKEKKSTAGQEMTLKLVRTPDIAAAANEQRKPGQVFVGFAAESENLENYALEKMKKKGFALVFANPVNQPDAGFAAENNRGFLIREGGAVLPVPAAKKTEIAKFMIHEMLKVK
ncbi:bifunctional phosphopantothenoylcysteine decarboxylase/phosphopantothenate--cysteine ligase CoaBC [soil metagenome]